MVNYKIVKTWPVQKISHAYKIGKFNNNGDFVGEDICYNDKKNRIVISVSLKKNTKLTYTAGATTPINIPSSLSYFLVCQTHNSSYLDVKSPDENGNAKYYYIRKLSLCILMLEINLLYFSIRRAPPASGSVAFAGCVGGCRKGRLP